MSLTFTRLTPLRASNFPPHRYANFLIDPGSGQIKLQAHWPTTIINNDRKPIGFRLQNLESIVLLNHDVILVKDYGYRFDQGKALRPSWNNWNFESAIYDRVHSARNVCEEANDGESWLERIRGGVAGWQADRRNHGRCHGQHHG